MNTNIETEILQIGNPILRQIAAEVTEVDHPKIQALIGELILITKQAHGVGIAAPQIGESCRIIIVSSHPNIRYPDAPFMPPLAMINPRIISYSEEVVMGTEGCLSVQKKRGNVPRYQDIMVEYIARDGNFRQEEYSNFIARIIQHELDHLNGILFVDHVRDQLVINN
jgi:peptide deformylase